MNCLYKFRLHEIALRCLQLHKSDFNSKNVNSLLCKMKNLERINVLSFAFLRKTTLCKYDICAIIFIIANTCSLFLVFCSTLNKRVCFCSKTFKSSLEILKL